MDIHVYDDNKSEGWKTNTVSFDDFPSLPSQRGSVVNLPSFHCSWYEWKLRLYPGGYGTVKDGMVSEYCSGEDIGDEY